MSTLNDISLVEYNNYQRNNITNANMRDSHYTNNSNNNSNTDDNNHDDTSIYIIEPIREEEDLLRQFTQWDNYVSNSHGSNTPKSSPQLRHRQKHEQSLIEQYKDSTHKDTYRTIRKFPSIRSKDFTSKREIHDNNNSNSNYNHGDETINIIEGNKYKRKNKKEKKTGLKLLSHLIFHRGFLKRSNIKKVRTKLLSNKRGPKFRNKNEFNSYLNYIDLISLVNDEYKNEYASNEKALMNDISNIIFPHRNRYRSNHFHEPSILPKSITLYKPINNNQIVVNKVLPRDVYLNSDYSKLLKNQFTQILNTSKFHNSTIRRKLSTRKQTSNTLNKVHNRQDLKRSKTLPNNYQYNTSKLNTHDNNNYDDKDIKETWSQYLQAVVTQRIRLRLSLLKSQPPSSIISSTNSSIHSGPSQERIKNH
ncbi:hypothetical protein RI543_002205 [Arxiozyma heterogenica]|uniref:Uncharacterized protein n=1 Tax=Arxiozyma heterogenica TaxID=278026 RepID=A0AAN7WPC3_9SACH|nr:hypothetical protein RI543_002205 [Kazachstania heterogenica]